MNTALLGYYGMQNFGDDLFCVVCVRRADLLFGGDRMLIAGPPLKDAPNTASLYPSMLPHEWFQQRGLLGQIARMGTGIRAFIAADRLVLAGGSVLGSVAGVRRIQGLLDRFTDRQWEALGVSLGPFATSHDAAMVQQFMKRFERITVRDMQSLNRANELGIGNVELSGDLACLYRAISEKPLLLEDRPLVLIPCAAVDTHSWKKVLRKAARVSSRAVVLSVNGNQTNGDRALAADTAQTLREFSIETRTYSYPEVGIDQVWSIIGSAEAVVTGRLHGAIAAYLQDVPFALVEYHEKCTEFVLDIGQPEELRITCDDSSAQMDYLVSDARKPTRSPEDYRARAEAALAPQE